jgi:hypothetical protein
MGRPFRIDPPLAVGPGIRRPENRAYPRNETLRRSASRSLYPSREKRGYILPLWNYGPGSMERKRHRVRRLCLYQPLRMDRPAAGVSTGCRILGRSGFLGPRCPWLQGRLVHARQLQIRGKKTRHAGLEGLIPARRLPPPFPSACNAAGLGLPGRDLVRRPWGGALAGIPP